MARSLFIAILTLLSMFNLFAAPAFADDSDSTPPAEEEEKDKEPEVILAPAPPPKPTKAKRQKKAKEVEAAPAEDPEKEPSVEIAGEHDPVVTLADPATVAAPLAPVDGGPRTRSIMAPRLGTTGSGYISFRLGYEYQAWLKPNWAVVLPLRFNVSGGRVGVGELRPWAEVGIQHTTSGQVGTLRQQLRLGVWANAFPAEASPSFTYSFDGEVGHRMLDLEGLVSWRPLSDQGMLYSEGSAGLWLFREGTFRLAGAWDTELGVGPRIDFNIKTVRFDVTVFLDGNPTVAVGAIWQF